MKPESRDGRRFESSDVTPADRIMADIGGQYWRLTEVADMIGVGHKTLRRLIAKGDTKAPSLVVYRGGMKMYLYTKEDLEELRNYYKKVEKRENAES